MRSRLPGADQIQDGQRGVVVLDNDVLELVELVVQYFYKHAYSDDDVVIKRGEVIYSALCSCYRSG